MNFLTSIIPGGRCSDAFCVLSTLAICIIAVILIISIVLLAIVNVFYDKAPKKVRVRLKPILGFTDKLFVPVKKKK